MEGFFIRRSELILPGCGGTSTLTRGTTLAARWLHKPQPISDHPVGLEFPHPAGRYRPGGSAFSSPACWSCRFMEGFIMRGWEIIPPGVRWLYVRSPVIQRSASGTANHRSAGGTGVFTPCGVVSTRGITVFVPKSPGCRSCKCIEGFLIRG